MFFPSLWLDASTGVNKFDYNYISRIVLNGDASVTGTYNASSVPTYNFEDQRFNDYSLGNINYGIYDGNLEFKIQTDNGYGNGEIGYESSNGINWSPYNGYTAQFTITGFTGIYTGANGTYYNSLDLYDSIYNNENGQFELYNNQLIYLNDYEHYPIIATKNNDGSFTPTNFITSITLFGASTTSVNGVYTRTAEEYATSFTGSEGRSINFGGYGEWYVDPGAIYATFDLQNWYGNNDESEEQIPPTASLAGTVRNIGSPRISSSVSNPNGSITGTITTSNVVTDYVASWNDQSANGRNVSQYDVGVPSTTIIADKKFINFSANTPLGGTTFFNSNYIGTIFVVANFDSSSAGSTSQLFSDYDGFKLGRGIDSTNAFYLQNLTNDYSETIRSTSNTNANNNTNYIIEVTFENNTASLYLNGVDAGNGSIGNLETPPNAQFLIGGGNGAEPANIAEVIAYNRVLNTSERQEVESYLANKYAISLA
jgi:hypothetical protein